MKKTPQSRDSKITRERLLEILSYDRLTGVFIWKERARDQFKSDRELNRWNTRYSGKPAGTPNQDGHILINISKTQFLAHRLAWLYVHGEWPTGQVDHWDVNPSNNVISNLREATHSQNLANRGPRRTSKSGVKGVHLRDSRWIAQIYANGKKRHLGSFNSMEAATSAYSRAAVEFHGEFARLK